MSDFLIFFGLFMLIGYIVVGLVGLAVHITRKRERRERVNRRRIVEGMKEDQ